MIFSLLFLSFNVAFCYNHRSRAGHVFSRRLVLVLMSSYLMPRPALAQCPLVTLSGTNQYPAGYQYTANTGPLPWVANGTSSAYTTSRLRGTLRIPKGVVVTMSYAILEFDDTRARWGTGYTSTNNLPSRLVIEPGGKLDARHCIFRTISGPASECMWDGIQVLGQPNIAQSSTNQGRLCMEDCQILDARASILAGAPSYSSTGVLLVGSLNGGGGGLVQIKDTHFLNCYSGAILRPNGLVGNGSHFEGCLFRADRPLADPAYTSGGFRYGSQYGASIYENRGIVFNNCTFELLDGNTAFNSLITPKAWRGDGVTSVNTTLDITNCTFRNLNIAVHANNINRTAFVVTVATSSFIGNVRGVNISQAGRSSVTDCNFLIGRANDEYDLGIMVFGTTGFRVRRNTLTANSTNCANGTCLNTRGIVLENVDGATTPYPNNGVYRNYFSILKEGIYTKSHTQGVLLRCNSFVGPNPETAPITYSITYSDITAIPGSGSTQTDFLRYEHGDCGRATSPANNLFSHTCGSAKDIRVTAPDSNRAIRYAYSSGNSRLVPGSTSGCYATTKVTKVPCTQQWQSYNADCPAITVETRTIANLRAKADTTSALATRVELLDEIIRRYLSDSAYLETGLYSALALLDTVALPLYAADRAAIAATINGIGNASLRGGGGADPRATHEGKVTTARTARRGATPELVPGRWSNRL